jgi:GNAT superfamily N-acetyltransferase
MRVERLGPHHQLSNFTCGTKSLDDWLRTHALENQNRNISRTFVLVDDSDSVVGYYSLTMGGVPPTTLPAHYRRGLPGYEIGMVLLARLAITSTRQGDGLGRDLLVDAIVQAAAAGSYAAARFIAVDPIDEGARAFYRHFGFRDVEGDEAGRMYLRVDHAVEALTEGRE